MEDLPVQRVALEIGDDLLVALDHDAHGPTLSAASRRAGRGVGRV